MESRIVNKKRRPPHNICSQQVKKILKGVKMNSGVSNFLTQSTFWHIKFVWPNKNEMQQIFKQRHFYQKNATKRCRQHARIHRRLSSTEGHLPPKVVLHQKSYSTEGCLPQKVIFHWRSSSTEGCLPPKVPLHRKSSSTKGCLPLKVIFHQTVVFLQRSSFTEGHLPPKVVFHWRLSSTKGRLPPTITPWLIIYLWEKSTHQIAAFYFS